MPPEDAAIPAEHELLAADVGSPAHDVDPWTWNHANEEPLPFALPSGRDAAHGGQGEMWYPSNSHLARFMQAAETQQPRLATEALQVRLPLERTGGVTEETQLLRGSTMPRFYVELVRHGMFPMCCGACHGPFLVGTLRLGYAGCRSSGVQPPPIWIHVPRCVRQANFVLQESDIVSFSPFVPAFERDRVLEALAANVPRSARPALMPEPQATRSWFYEPYTLQHWVSARVPRPAAPSPPPLAAPPRPPSDVPSPPGGILPSFMAAIPVLTLCKAAPEPCVICWEELLPGQQARRLPCLHLFHRSCIDRWLTEKPTCPLDNSKVAEALALGGGDEEVAEGEVRRASSWEG